ncbi:hypothetical protein E4U55_003478 [Claviceps digitariae]|nr:hypothetical protein E4U55_003478 [Claviceps digitariae]
MKKRISSSCDACAFRRVKCSSERPCRECQIRALDCTSLRNRGKRGPKGPRPDTSRKVRQGRLSQSEPTPTSSHQSTDSHGSAQSPSIANHPTCSRRLPLDAYCKYLNIFRHRLGPIWPVVDVEDLIFKISSNPHDLESYALAASICAATIAQIRLSEHTNSPNVPVSSHQFSQDAQIIRDQYDYHECENLSSILTPYFLHVYFVNASKIKTAASFLRESIASVHWLGLDQQETYDLLGHGKERSLKLRIFWILFISERTFCAQNSFPAVLAPIDEIPSCEETNGDFNSISEAFSSLTQLFSHLKVDILETWPSRRPVLVPEKVMAAQATLCRYSRHSSFTEIQRVDLFVTRQWIRLLIWEYTMRHYRMSRESSSSAFSLLLPFRIAKELLPIFPAVSAESISAHGYGMELKVFRVADAVLDLADCAPVSIRAGGIFDGAGDILYSLRNVLLEIGGSKSSFLGKLHTRMAVSEFLKQSRSYPDLRLVDNHSHETDGNENAASGVESPQGQQNVL